MQRSFDDLGTPLCDVTFVVVDLETTGGAPGADAITEIGAVKLRGGECLGTFQTLVNPRAPIPPAITYLTGITQSMVLPAPTVDEVLPAFLEFASDAVLVGHNVRFDASHLNAALRAHGRPRLANRIIDTCALARRLVRDEVPNCTLSTLAEYFRVGHRPTHRALDDALATGELLHCLLERAGTMGVTGLDDLIALPTVKGHPQLAKLKLVTGLPRQPGVYLFRDRNGRVLYVGKAVDIRRRVRSYFSSDERRKVGQLLREAEAIDHIVCSGELEASVLEVRLIHELTPRFNRQLKRWKKYAYLKLTLDERFPRLSVVKAPKPDDGCLYLGPLGSAGTARSVADAIEAVAPLRRCSAKVPKTPLSAPCAPAQLGVATCPCAQAVTEAEYSAIVALVVRGLTKEPALLLGPLAAKMSALAAAERYEEAATLRDRAGALSRALIRQRRIDSLRQAGRLTVEIPGEGGATLDHGLLVAAWAGEAAAGRTEVLPLGGGRSDGPVPRHLIDELACVAAWIDAKASRLRLVACDAGLSLPVAPLPRFDPR
jgi:DNA polymerase-3 subunit epsilon